jgi:hypothetical protein
MIGVNICVWKPSGGLNEDFLYVVDLEFFITFTKMFYKGKTYNLLPFHAIFHGYNQLVQYFDVVFKTM